MLPSARDRFAYALVVVLEQGQHGGGSVVRAKLAERAHRRGTHTGVSVAEQAEQRIDGGLTAEPPERLGRVLPLGWIGRRQRLNQLRQRTRVVQQTKRIDRPQPCRASGSARRSRIGPTARRSPSCPSAASAAP